MAHQNRLAGETSPYLLQHAGNPVDWYPWGEEALERARAENRPILAAGALQRLVSPGVPVDRILGVLEQVGAGLARKPVHARSVSSNLVPVTEQQTPP